MMILARGLAGLQIGAVTTLTFTYFDSSFENYEQNVETLKRVDKKRLKQHKGYLFSTFSIGTSLGYALGLGMCNIYAAYTVRTWHHYIQCLL